LIAVSVIGLLLASFFIFKYIRRRNIPERIRARYGGSLAKIKVACISLCFRCERYCLRRPNVQPRQEVNSTDQLNIARSTRNQESIVSGSDGHIDVPSIGGPLCEQPDNSSAPTFVPYDVPCFPSRLVPCSAYDIPPPDYVPMDCIPTSSANPVRQPFYENA
jgi:hypothetical protein